MSHRNILCTNQPQIMNPNLDSVMYQSTYCTTNTQLGHQFMNPYAPMVHHGPGSCRFVPVPQPVPVVPPPVLCPVGPTMDKRKDDEDHGGLYMQSNNNNNGISNNNVMNQHWWRNNNMMSQHPVYVNQVYGGHHAAPQWGYVNTMGGMYYPQQMVPVQMQAGCPYPPPPHHPMMGPPRGAFLGHPSGVVRLGPRIPSYHLPSHPNVNPQPISLSPSEDTEFEDIDEHIDMRLDIDGMTYEELLDLEERIGDVKTGLDIEIISKKLKIHFYSDDIINSSQNEPCTICQVEFEEREEIGTLDCGHMYHSDCIKQWLEIKNMCPICKKVALR